MEGTVKTILTNLKQLLSTKEEEGHRRETSGVIEGYPKPQARPRRVPNSPALKKGQKKFRQGVTLLSLAQQCF